MSEIFNDGGGHLEPTLVPYTARAGDRLLTWAEVQRLCGQAEEDPDDSID